VVRGKGGKVKVIKKVHKQFVEKHRMPLRKTPNASPYERFPPTTGLTKAGKGGVLNIPISMVELITLTTPIITKVNTILLSWH